MIRAFLLTLSFLAATSAFAADQSAVHVEPAHLQGPRTLEKQTETAVIRDYLEAWQSLSTALEQNRAAVLDTGFVGTAKDKLTDTIEQQSKLGIHTRYKDRAHNLQIVFYSPEGLSIQLVDHVEYDMQVLDHDKLLATQRVRARYVTILTPSEVRWRVRILQAVPE